MILKFKQNNQMHHTDNLGNWDCIVCPDVLPVSDPISSELKKKHTIGFKKQDWTV